MNPENIDLVLENNTLKNEFVIRNLDLSQVFVSSPDNLELENRHLNKLLDWVNKYTICLSRKEMEDDGYLYPPIEPGFSPDNDWFLFERWINGLPVRLRALDQISTKYVPKDPNELSDSEIISELERLDKFLYDIRICVDLREGIPPKLIYENLIEMLNEEFDLMIEGFYHIDGCSGFCPDCFQRPWCEAGSQSCWPEDEKIGEMYLPDCVRKYVSPSPVSLSILQKNQAEEDKKFEELNKTHKLDGDSQSSFLFFDGDDEDVLPF